MVIMAVLLMLMLVLIMTAGLGDGFVATQSIYRQIEARERNYTAARSVVELAMELLRADDNDSDSFEDPWAAGKQTLPFDGREFSLEIRDEDRLFPVNQLVLVSDSESGPLRDSLQRFLQRAGLPPEEATDSLMDWCDPDNIRRPAGAEQGDYGADYPVKNAPLDSVFEVDTLRGWAQPNLPRPPELTRDPLAGLSGEARSQFAKLEEMREFGKDAADKDSAEDPQDQGRPELPSGRNPSRDGAFSDWSDWLTVWSAGKININTAPAELLNSLDDRLSEAQVQEIVTQREQSPLHSDQDLRNVAGIDADLAYRLSRLVGYKSGYFRIRVSVEREPGRMVLEAVVKRDGGNLKVVDWVAN